MTLRRKIKENALLSLKENWGRAISILMFQMSVYTLFMLLEQVLCGTLELTAPGVPGLQLGWFGGLRVSGRLAVITGSSLLVSEAVLLPLILGVKRWYCEQVTGQRSPFLTIFAYFSDWKTLFRVIFLRVAVGLRKLLWGILFSIPSVIILTAFHFVKVSSTLSYLFRTSGIILGGMTAVISAILWYFVTLRYFLVDYLFIYKKGSTIGEMIRISVAAMKGGKQQLFSLQLSMLPWFLLSFLVIPLFFIVPYFASAVSIFAMVRMHQRVDDFQKSEEN